MCAVAPCSNKRSFEWKPAVYVTQSLHNLETVPAHEAYDTHSIFQFWIKAYDGSLSTFFLR